MKTITMLEFRRNSGLVIRRAKAGERMLLTYRGKALFRLEPCVETRPAAEDPFYRLAERADNTAAPLSNQEMDEAVYGN